jgi:hypothetical protein
MERESMANEPAFADHRRTTSSVVYFVTPSRSRRVKIGTTIDLPSRLQALQAMNHVPLLVLLTLPGGIGLEGQLHERFKRYHVHSELFTLSDEIKEFIGEHGGRWMPPSGSYSTKRNRRVTIPDILAKIDRLNAIWETPHEAS